MQTREHLRLFLLANKFSERNPDSFFAKLPYDVVCEIGKKMIVDANDYWRSEEAPGSAIAKALHYAAYARKEDVAKLLAMLDKNPLLLLQRGNVMTPGGLDCQEVTLYEFCLGAGDPELAAFVSEHFSKVPDG